MLKFKNYSIRNYFKNKKQQGASAIIAAFSIPLMMVGGVAAVDLGAYWSHATELQNAADAAALAGAANYAKYEGNKDELADTTVGRDKADEAAKSYVGTNLNTDGVSYYTKDRPITAVKFGKNTQVDNENYQGEIYYRVKLTDTSPSYFAKFFKLTDPEIEVYSIASIAYDKKVPLVDEDTDIPITDLFIFKNKISCVNSVQNPDTCDSPTAYDKILTAFDGQISYTKANANLTEPEITASGNGAGRLIDPSKGWSGDNWQPLQNFYTSKGRDANRSESNPLKETSEKVSMYDLNSGATDDTKSNYDTGTTTSTGKDLNETGYWTTPQEKEYNMEDEFGAQMKKKAESSTVYDWTSSNGTISSYSITKALEPKWTGDNSDAYGIVDGVINVKRENIGVQNINISIDEALPGADNVKLKDDPIYVYMDEGMDGVVNININSDNERPMIICMPNATQVHLNINNGATFRGIIYAPICGDYDTGGREGVLVNMSDGGTFSGTIMAGSVNLQGAGNATYRYENFSLQGGGGGDPSEDAENTSISYDSSISLVPLDYVLKNGEGEDWEDEWAI